MKKFIAGVIVGAVVATAGSAVAAPVKQYVLTLANYPIFVNGKEYKDASKPILQYNGSTYVPLAKLADLTGVQYTWNVAAKRVEIGGTLNPKLEAALAEQEAIEKFTENTPAVVEENVGLVGGTLYAYDKFGNFVGAFTDNDNTSYVIAQLQRKPLPPSIKDGWTGLEILEKAYGEVSQDGNDLVVKTHPFVTKQVEYYRFHMPEGYQDITNGDIEANGVRIKIFDKALYLNIKDLQKVGLLK
ncbi:stalk domain-containing protein [Gorillibacterium sp. sgz500922]|uniref:stalk domain-containing protein n=1 Tax=Gorillibacterium sp. sgz500922 TaxID=3446694 RepID=UPI003F67C961